MSSIKPFSTTVPHLSDLNDFIGKEIGLTNWISISQEDINSFAKLTKDDQWIHVDPERCLKESPYGKPVAHGFMLLSYASRFAYDCMSIGGVVMGVNYGLNKVRFMSPTPVDSRVRGRLTLTDCTEIVNGYRYVLNIIYEIEGQDKPACVADFVAQVYGS